MRSKTFTLDNTRGIMKPLLIILGLLIIALLLTDLASDDSDAESSGKTGDCTWNLSDDRVLTISGNGATEDYIRTSAPWGTDVEKVVISEGVTYLGYGSFRDCRSLTSVSIADTVTSIGGCCFGYCTGLTSIALPGHITGIYDQAFLGCTSLTDITLPSTVTHLGSCIFENCTSLEQIYVSSENTSYRAVEGVLYTYDMKKLIQYPAGNARTEFTVPNSVEVLRNFAFGYASSLTSIDIGNSVTDIESGAFDGCSSLLVMTFKNSTPPTINGEFLPDMCTDKNTGNLHYIIVPEGSVEAYRTATGWDSYANIIVSGFDDGKTWQEQVVESYADEDFSYVLYLGGRLAVDGDSIPEYAFAPGTEEFGKYSEIIKTVELSSTVTSIGSGAFSMDKNIKSFKVSSENTSYCSIDDVLYSKDVKTLIMYPLGNTRSEFTVPDTVTSIESSSFACCNHLKTVTLGSSVVSISGYAFAHCGTLSSISLDDSLVNIGQLAFYNCPSLERITLPCSLRSIGSDAFIDCKSLKNIVNDSFIDLQIGSEDHGKVAYYAETITGNLIVGTSGDYSVTYNDHSRICRLDKYSGNSMEVVVPDKIIQDGTELSVRIIGTNAFQENTNITKVDIPDSITFIEKSAFCGCSSLTSVTIPESITSIERNTFFECSSLTSVTIPSSVTSIGMDAFMYCTSLYSIRVSPGNLNYCSVEDILYTKDMKTLVQYPIGNVRTEFTIPDGVETISAYSFDECSNLKNVTIPGSVTTIGSYAFAFCTSLESLSIPDSVTTIEHQAFYGCHMRIVNIGNSITSIESTLGDDLMLLKIDAPVPPSGISLPEICTSRNSGSLHYIIVPEGSVEAYRTATGWDSYANIIVSGFDNGKTWQEQVVESYADDDFSYTLYLGGRLEVGGNTIPYKAFSSDDEHFDNYSYLIKYVEVSDSIVTIEDSSFQNCDKITTIHLGASVKTLGDGIYFGCSSLSTFLVSPDNLYYCSSEGMLYSKDMTTIIKCPYANKCGDFIVPDTVVSIGATAFEHCRFITSITAGNSLRSIGDSAFAGCFYLVDIHLGDSLVSIGNSAFWEDPIEDVTIPDSVETIEQNAFGGCIELKSVIIGNNLANILDATFEKCTSLESVTIGYSVSEIANSAFSGCTALKNVINDSWLEIKKGSEEYGYIAYNADKIQGNIIHSTSGDFSVTCNDHSMLCRITDYSGPASIMNIPEKIELGDVEYVVWSIDERAFDYCDLITSVIIPGSVSLIGERAFYGCYGIKSFSVSEKNMNYASRNGVLYTKDIGTLIQYPAANENREFIIPDTVVSIEHDAFDECRFITSLTIPSTTTGIESDSFPDYCFYASEDSDQPLEINELAGHMFHGKSCENLVASESHTAGKPEKSIVKQPTCTETGMSANAYHCTICGVLLSYDGGETIPALGHKEMTLSGTSPTCTRTGLTDGIECSVCHAALIEQKVIPALPHTGSASVKENIIHSTFENGGSYDSVVYCSVCGTEITRESVITNILTPAAVDYSTDNIKVTVSENMGIQKEDVQKILNESSENVNRTLEITMGQSKICLDNHAIEKLDPTKDICVSADLVKSISVPGTTGNSIVYDISLGDNHSFYGGKITITVPYSGPSDDLKVYYLVDGQVQETLSCTYSDRFVTFSVDHLSTFAIAQADASTDSSDYTPIITIVVIIVLIILGTAFVIRRSHNKV